MRGMLTRVRRAQRPELPNAKNNDAATRIAVEQQADAEQVVIAIGNQNRCAQST